jgi:hypothetical protein
VLSSAEKLFKLAGNAEAAISFEVKDQKGKTISLEVKKSEVKTLQHNAVRAKRANKNKQITRSKLRQLTSRDEIFDLIGNGTNDEQTVLAIAKLLMSRRQKPLVLDIASELESRGQYAAAKIFRDTANQIPPDRPLLLK